MTSVDPSTPSPAYAGGSVYVPRIISNRECLVLSTQPENLDFTFVVKKDHRSGKTYYVNVQTRNRVWELPDVADVGPMPPLPPSITRGTTVFTACRSSDGEHVYAPKDLPIALVPAHCWIPHADRVHQKYFFVNAKTGEKVMYLPPTADLLDRVQRMYAHYQLREELGQPPFEECAASWAGHESQLLADLVLRFGPEPLRPQQYADIFEAYVDTVILPNATHCNPDARKEAFDALLHDPRGHSQVLAELTKLHGPPPKSKRQRILEMYAKYNPTKLHQVDDVVDQYAGRLDTLLSALVNKFGPEPTAEETTRSFSPSNSGGARHVVDAAVNDHVTGASFLSAATSADDTCVSNGSGTLSSDGVPRSGSSAPPSTSPAAGTTTSPVTAGPAAYRARLVQFYRCYNPSKVATVDETLSKYAGQEDFLMDQLVRKYGPEPIVSPGVASLDLPCSASDAVDLAAVVARDEVTSPPLPPPQHGMSTAAPLPKTPSDRGSDTGSANRTATTSFSVIDRIQRMYAFYTADSDEAVASAIASYPRDEKTLLRALIGAHGPEPTDAQLQQRALERDGAAEAARASGTRSRRRGPSVIDQARNRVRAILRVRAPDMVTSVDQLLHHYAGREEALITELIEAYGDIPDGDVEQGNERQNPAAREVGGKEPNELDTYAHLSLEQLRQRHSDAARAENAAFLATLDKPQPSTNGVATQNSDEGGAGANGSTAPPKDHRETPLAAVEANCAAAPQQQPLRRSVAVAPGAVLSPDTTVGRLTSVEQRLQDALDSTERVLKRNELLHEENVRLTQAYADLRRQCDDDLHAIRRREEELRIAANRVQHEFALERIQLKMQEEGVVLKLKQETQEERSKFVEEHLKTLAEKKQLEQLLLDLHAARASNDANIRSLEAKVKRREAELGDARAEVKFLTIQLDRPPTKEAATQTEVVDAVSQKANTKAVLASSEGLQTEIAIWRDKGMALERELEVANSKQRQSEEECQNAAKFIHVLRTKQKKLEDTIATLELRALAQPNAAPSKSELDCRRLEDEVLHLQRLLDDAKRQAKEYRREIAELRSLLSLHMTGATAHPRRVPKY